MLKQVAPLRPITTRDSRLLLPSKVQSTPGAARKLLFLSVTCVPLASAVELWPCTGVALSDAPWSLELQLGSSSGAGPSDPERRGWKRRGRCALPASWLETWAGVKLTCSKMAHAPGLSLPLPPANVLPALQWVLLCCCALRLLPQWRSSEKTSTGKWDCGAALFAQPFSPSSALSYFFSPPSLFPSVCPASPPPASLCQKARRRARTH